MNLHKIFLASDSDDYDTFCKLIEPLNNDFLLAVLLFTGTSMIQSHRCCNKVIDTIKLSDNQLKLCVLFNLECIESIFAKDNMVYNKQIRTDLLQTLAISEKDANTMVIKMFKEVISFTGSDEDLQKINSWVKYASHNSSNDPELCYST